MWQGGDVDYNLFISYSLFYLWISFVLAAPVALLIARPSMEHRRLRAIVWYVISTVLWIVFFYRVVPSVVDGWRFGALTAAGILCVSPWVLSWCISSALRRNRTTVAE